MESTTTVQSLYDTFVDEDVGSLHYTYSRTPFTVIDEKMETLFAEISNVLF